MPLPSTSIKTVEIQVRGTIASAGGSSKSTNFVFHFARTTTVAPIAHAAIDTAFQTAVVVPIGTALNVRWLQSSNSVRYVDDALDAPIYYSHAQAGLVAGDSMPSHSSVYLLMRTGIRGKSYRGSKHLAPVSESDTSIATADILNAGALVNFGAVATAILTGFTDANGNIWKAVVLSKTLSQLITNPTTVVANEITQIMVNKRIGNMKKRQVASVY